VLNSSDACNPVACGVGSAQLAWLHADLAAHTSRCTLAYWHHPHFSSDSFHGGYSVVKPFWDELYAAGADVVLNGHAHVYERFAPQDPDGNGSPNGVRQFTVGTGGYYEHEFEPTPFPTSEARESGTFGVLRLVLRDDSYSWQFLPKPGQTFADAGSASCH
jgi:hypothetical protein